MAVSAGAFVVSTVAGAVMGNQEKQKAKGEAGQAERDAQAAQQAADAKLEAQHIQALNAQSQAGAIARKAMGGTVTPAGAPPMPHSAPAAPPSVAPITPRKTLLGQ